ncbi:19146_t:CDS:2 [Entrophospora sp. SA101]|nr:19146_t:CDS:2 [Entrophospora sp. SA101]CAJ0831894.1 1119_t:CDS:2 [Entrophospora sp. SA101]
MSSSDKNETVLEKDLTDVVESSSKENQKIQESNSGVDDNDNNNTSTHSVIPKISLRKPQDEDKQTLRKKGR